MDNSIEKAINLSMTELEEGFYIGPWRIEPKLNKISMLDNGEVIAHIVTPKVMVLCLLLAENQGEPISQKTIADRVWPGLAISDSSIYQAIAKLRKALHDNKPQKQFIERVSGKGYRLIPSVEPRLKEQQTPIQIPTDNQMAAKDKITKRLALAAFIIITLLVWFVSSYYLPKDLTSKVSSNVKPFNLSSIAIRPTKNLTHPRQEKLDTFSHLLLSDLLSIPDIKLILMRDNQQSSDALAELTHSLSIEDDKLLLSAQLTERSSQRVIWAAEFNAPNNALLNLKHQLTTALTSVLISEQPKQPLALDPKTNLSKSSYESFVLAQYLWNKRKPASLQTAEQLYKDILQAYPDNVETLVGLCNTYLFLHTYSDWTEEKAYSACAPLIEKANQLSPQNGKVLATKALLLPISDSEAIVSLFEASITHAPNYANAYLWYGNFLRRKGSVEKALTMHQKALSLDPLSPNINRNLAYSLLNLRQLSAARQYYQRALTIEPQYSLRPVEELDFLPLNIERARQFFIWSKNNASNLSQRAPYLLTRSLVRLGLGQIAEASALAEEADINEVNQGFWLYTQAALNTARGKTELATSQLKERYLNSLIEQENTNRHVMPYLSLLMHGKQYDEAYRLFISHFPDIHIDKKISDENDGQFVFLHALLLSTKRNKDAEDIALKITNYFSHVEQPQLTLPYIQWLTQSKQNQAAKLAIEALFKEGWLPDFNDNILAETNLRGAYIHVGGEQHQFDTLLSKNRHYSLN